MSDLQTAHLLKRCKTCGIEYNLTEFYFNSEYKGKKYPSSSCKKCSKVGFRDNYSKNKEKIREKQQKLRKENPDYYAQQSSIRYLKKKEEAVEYMGGCCQDCGGIFPSFVYDFHHIDPSMKDSSWSLGRSWDYLKEELDKCVLLCANCHRIRHWK